MTPEEMNQVGDKGIAKNGSEPEYSINPADLVNLAVFFPMLASAAMICSHPDKPVEAIGLGVFSLVAILSISRLITRGLNKNLNMSSDTGADEKMMFHEVSEAPIIEVIWSDNQQLVDPPNIEEY